MTIAMLCVGVVFQTSSSAVGTSQALLEQMESVRAIDMDLRRDLAGMDKRAFLVIRSRMLDPHNPNSPRFDQMSFLAYGSFPNTTGADDRAHPFDDTVANAAHIWWGQLMMQRLDPPDESYLGSPRPHDPRQKSMPTGVVWDHDHWVHKEEECVLGRNATLLLPGSGNGDIYPRGRPLKASADIRGADGASSRYCVAAIMPWEIVDHIKAAPDAASMAGYCYRFQALSSVYDSKDAENPFIDGYFQMHPIVMRGVSSVKIDWTDGTVDDKGQLAWFGPTHFQGGPVADLSSPVTSVGDEGVEWIFADGNKYGQDYLAVFEGSRAQSWPKALRITYHVVDIEHRLRGGRDYAVVASLPD